jgi:hypothetical protein
MHAGRMLIGPPLPTCKFWSRRRKSCSRRSTSKVHRCPEGRVGGSGKDARRGIFKPGHAKYEAELKTVTKKHGFKNFAEYKAVAANIFLVMMAIDPQTKVFMDPQTAIKKEIEDASTDKTIPSNEKKKLLRGLNAALNAAQSIQFPTNIELVQKYYDKIDVTTIAAYDGDSRPNSSVVRTISE